MARLGIESRMPVLCSNYWTMLPPLKWCFCAFGEWMLDFFFQAVFSIQIHNYTHLRTGHFPHVYCMETGCFHGFCGDAGWCLFWHLRSRTICDSCLKEVIAFPVSQPETFPSLWPEVKIQPTFLFMCSWPTLHVGTSEGVSLQPLTPV